VRRRRAALAGAALVALVVGIVVGANNDNGEHAAATRPATAPPQPALERARALPPARRLGELLMISFKGPGVPRYVRQALRAGRAGGVILFRGNASTPAQMRAVTRTLQRAGRGRVLIAVDQEGGPIRTLPWAHPVAAQSAIRTPVQATTEERQAARDLARAGVNVALAPVADVAVAGSSMQGRAFPGSAAQVAAITRAAVRAYRGSHVAPTLKHFPGLGRATANTDGAPVTISGAIDAGPFAAGIRAGAPLVMASHALYPALDPANIASQSRAILTGLLRNKLHFAGVVITDSLEARAVLARSSVETAALRSVSAGADIVLMTGAASFPGVRRVLTVAARRSPRFRARIAQAAARVIALKASLGLRTPPR
jgi:beta-N-acetylhexosaminidase